MSRCPLAPCIAAAWLIGCSSGGFAADPADEPGEGDGRSEDLAGGNSGSEGSSIPCREATDPLSSLDEVHPIVGFSADDVLELVGGQRNVPMRWHARDSGPIVKDGDDTLTISVEPREGELRAMYCEEGDAGEAARSPARLLIPVEIGLETEDRTLDERFEAELVVSDPELVAIDLFAEPEELAGSLGSTVGAFYSGGQRNLIFGLTFTADGVTGSILGPYATDRAKPCRETIYATWPPDAACFTGEVAEPTDADAMQVHLDRANRTFALSWDDGEISDARLIVELDGATTCRRSESERSSIESVRHRVRLHIASEDGRADLRLSGWLHGGPGSEPEPELGPTERAPYYLHVWATAALDADGMRAAFGDSVAAVPAAIASVIVSTDQPVEATPAALVRGELRVVEIDRSGFATPLPVGEIPAEQNERCFDSAGEQRSPLFTTEIALDGR